MAEKRGKVLEHPEMIRCAFCNKGISAVTYMIAGPTVFICGGCVDICNDILAEEKERQAKAAAEGGDHTTQQGAGDGR